MTDFTTDEEIELAVPIWLVEQIVSEKSQLQGDLKFNQYLQFEEVVFDKQLRALIIKSTLREESIN